MLAPLEEVGDLEAARFGGKASMLGAMLGDGLRVLPGVAVSADAYERAVELAGATEMVAEFWRQGKANETGSVLANLSAEIAVRLQSLDLSELAASILAGLGEADAAGGELIVRSSATGEDSAHLSYAGQFTSQRCPGNPADVEAAIAAVWASCTAANVATYRTALANPTESPTNPPSMGLVAQPYRRFSTSGLVFTAHPVVSLEGWMLLEYLDEEPSRLVSGEILPNRCRVNVESGRVVWERRREDRPELSPEHVSELLTGAAKLKRLAGTHVDVEWGLYDDAVFYLQSRPITSRPRPT